jgi:hypothetical protein
MPWAALRPILGMTNGIDDLAPREGGVIVQDEIAVTGG